MRVFFLLVEYHSSAKVFPTIKLKNIKASATCNEKRVIQAQSETLGDCVKILIFAS
jgi:hypothetical protein